MTCRHAYNTDSVQDHLLQRTLDLRGPGLVPRVEILQQIKVYGQQYENNAAWGTASTKKQAEESPPQEQEATARRHKSKAGKKGSGSHTGKSKAKP